MDDLRQIIAANIVALRGASRMTQAELAEKLNYSDKAISKWERAESAPDVRVLQQVADLFGVSVDYLLTNHSRQQPPAPAKAKRLDPKVAKNIMLLSVVSVWFLAMVAFTVLWALGQTVWVVFVWAVPVSLVVLLVLNSVWNRGAGNFIIITGLVWSVLLLLYLMLLEHNVWPILLFGIPAQVIICLSFRFIKLTDPEEGGEGPGA